MTTKTTNLIDWLETNEWTPNEDNDMWFECGPFRLAREDQGYWKLFCFTSSALAVLDFQIDFSTAPDAVIIASVEAVIGATSC